MPDNTTRNVAAALGGVLVGGILVYGVLSSRASEDQDRPPIIVRGGSLIFESGDSTSSDPNERKGNPWMQYNGDWQPDYSEGNKVKWFSVNLQGGNPSLCPGLSRTKKVTIVYEASVGGQQTTFALNIKPRPKSGSPAPAIEGAGLTPNSSNPQVLSYGTPGQGSIARIEFQGLGSNVNCSGPSGAIIWAHQ